MGDNDNDVQPCGRTNHTLTLISLEAVALFGGEEEGSQANLGDCWLLDLTAASQRGEATSMWKRCKDLCNDLCQDICVHSRSDHAAELEPESGRLWIMGGMTEKEDYQKVCPTEMM